MACGRGSADDVDLVRCDSVDLNGVELHLFDSLQQRADGGHGWVAVAVRVSGREKQVDDGGTRGFDMVNRRCRRHLVLVCAARSQSTDEVAVDAHLAIVVERGDEHIVFVRVGA